jgi:hypothetical protein
VLWLAPTPGAGIEAEEWREPPMDARPVARWWWPGGAVDEEGIASQLERIRAAGFGAVELQPLLLGMSEEDLAADPRVRSVGSPTFARHVGLAAQRAAELGLRFDLTLGSGWPGGLPGAQAAAEQQLLVSSLDVEGPTRLRAEIPAAEPPGYVALVQRVLDTMGPFDPELRRVAVLAVRLADAGLPATIAESKLLTSEIGDDGRIDWSVPPGRWRILVFRANRTGHSVLGGAYPGAAYDALVVDHLSRRGARALLSGHAEPLLAAVPAGSVRSIFIDSFELIGELPWTDGFRAAFRTRKGYDPTRFLPLLFVDGGESKYSQMLDFFGRSGGAVYLDAGGSARRARLREDYEDVREALFLEEFLGTFMAWGRERGIEIRLQAHGGFADVLDAYAVADVPEAEGLFAGGSADFLRLAASAAHVAGRHIASSESFITLRLYGTALEVPELDLLAGRALSAGINQIVHHGVPYPYARSDGRAWYPFSGGFRRILAGPFPMTTWFRDALWEELPALNLRLARLCLAMRQGEHVADVAWLHAARELPDAPSFEFGRVDPLEGESAGSRALRARGLVTDRVSRRQLRDAVVSQGSFRVGAAHYRALLLDPMEAAEPELVERAVAIARAGVPVLAIGALPRRSRGLVDADLRDRALAAAVAELRTLAVAVATEEELGDALETLALEGPLVAAGHEPLRLSIDHRRSAREHILLLFNESWTPLRQRLRVNLGGGAISRWDPRSGEVALLTGGTGSELDLTLGPAESIVLTIADALPEGR